MFLDRRRGRPVRYLEWRIRLMGAGALLAILGMYFGAEWMIWLAIGVLLAGFLLRFGGREAEDEDAGDLEDEDDWSDEER